MSDSDKSGWPGALRFPFMPFLPAGATPPAKDAPASGLTSGMGLLTSLWSQLPGSTQVPGFLMPTVDLDELDKRIGDLRAAESWVEVNLNLLRSTIQGLEVQRNTIAALHALSMPQQGATARPAPAVAAPAPAATPTVAAADAPAAVADEAVTAAPPAAVGDWLGYLQGQFAQVAEAALAVTRVAEAKAASAPKRPVDARAPASKKTASRRRKAG